ncbi:MULTISPECIES: response regulator [unclassified Agarivorans]|uniref:response regulator n=1 Tax=unclassified Agarivorans TaxID=2636026 RepID=UPI0026E33695|nr:MULTISPECIES: response regulator transcription factor [unclassified Agarivorans]MDO6687831.1 response regulator transcription factor [Agarivorans sp. 3_MG-2023]MDO6717453.1 response regulator transcription factor [Agarivorans sp. 2_MG-2023]
MTSILLVDDHPLVQDGLKMRLEANPGFNVVGTAADGEQALSMAQQLCPDIVLTDINMPKLNGIQLLEALAEQCPNSKVVMLSMHDNKEYVQNAMRNGAKGYLLKDIASSELISALEAIANGGRYISAGVSNMLFDNESSSSTVSLTKREQQVLRLLATGCGNKKIADSLSISIRTVETHTLKIRRKLDLDSSVAMIKYAIEHYGSEK